VTANDVRPERGSLQGWEPAPQCVVVSCFREDFEFLRRLLGFSEIRFHRAETIDEADFLLTVTGATVLISDIVFLDGCWEDALDMVLSVHPRASFVLAAEPVDYAAAGEAMRRGACAVLKKPWDFMEMIRTIRTVHEAVGERILWEEAEAG